MKAVAIAHWPGKDVPCCVDHLKKLRALAEGVLGFNLSYTTCNGSDIECTNCVNEAKKNEAA